MSEEHTAQVDHRLKFGEEYMAPIYKGEKTATVRIGLERNVSVGDRVTAELPGGSGFADIEITRTASCLACEALLTIEVFEAQHNTDDTQELLENLNDHYPNKQTRPGTVVDVLVFEVDVDD